ncbi:MAG: immunoglobulin-like domain-containing protein [Pyrinomonadaceae bacterium]
MSYSSLSALPQAGAPTISLYAGDCSTGKTVFNLQDADKTVCAEVTGAAPGWVIIWSNSNSIALQNAPVGSGTSTFPLTTNSSLGDWRVILYEPFGGSVQKVASFTVVDAANPQVDLSISGTAVSGSASTGAQVVFAAQVTNGGPSDAVAIQLVDSVPANTTFVSFSQREGPLFNCSNPSSGGTGTTVCTIPNLGRGERAIFLGTYLVDSGVAVGDSISNTTTVSNSVSDLNTENDFSTASVRVANSPCVLTCPANITVSADSGQAGAVVTYSAPTTSGVCGEPVTSNPASGSFFPIGTTTVTSTSTMGGVCTFQVTVDNPGGLAISLSGANPAALECGSDFEDSGATAVNGNGDPLTVVVSGTVDSHTPGSYTLTYTATEGPNSVSTTRTVNVSDSEAPVITIEGSNPMTVNPGQTFIDPGAVANDACEGVRPVSSSGTVDSNVPGTYTITYTASDSQNRTATATRSVIVESGGTAPPTITVNGDPQVTIECGSTFTDPGATATASGGGSVPVITSGTVDTHTPGTYTITYTACVEDSPGHCDPNLTSQRARSVTVEDTAAPTIEVLGANPMTVECHTSFADPGATAHDACAGDFAATAVSTVDANTVGQYTVTYSATDPSGQAATSVTRVVNVVDTTGPVVTAPAAVTVHTGAGATSCGAIVGEAALGTASANDSCAGSVATSRSGVPSGNVFPVGQTTITYSATDAHNNTGTATQTVTVIDNTPPTITLNGANSMTVECHTSFTDPGATAHDNCSPDSAATASGSVNVNVVGSYTITYDATDAAGNNATSVTRTVNVVDTTAPTIALNGANPMTVECHTTFTDPGATANDSCAGNLTSSIVATGTVNSNVVGSYTLTYSVNDGQGNATTATRTVNVVDTIAPAISCPANMVVYLPLNSTATSMAVSYPAVTATDSCSTPNITSSPASGSVFPVGTTTVNATATDEAGNSSNCSFTVTVLYNFTGFFSPVGNPPILNSVNAGRAIPVKFSLSGYKGLNIFAANNPYSVSFNCATNDPGVDVTETLTAGGSSLSFGGDQYNYVWKTESSWAGTCRQLVVTLNDGSVHTANFKFK